MSQNKIRISIVLVVAILLIISFFLFIRFSVKPDWVKSRLLPRLEEVVGSDVEFSDFKIHTFPLPYISMTDVEVHLKELNQEKVQIGELKAYLRILPLFVKRGALSKLVLSEAQTTIVLPNDFLFSEFETDHVNLVLSSIKPKAPMKVEMEGDLEGVPGSFEFKGFWTVPKLEKWDWFESRLEGTMKVRNLPLRVLQKRLQIGDDYPVRLKDGTVTTELELRKEPDESWFHVKGDGNLQQFVYEIKEDSIDRASPAIDAGLKFDVSWDHRSEMVRIKRFSTKLPIGTLEVSGGLSLGTKEVQSMRVTATGIAMESIPHYFLPLKEAIPFNIGFSGQSDLEMSLEGTLDHLSIYANWDLTPTLLVYARYFNKPKDLPLTAVFDYLLKDQRFLSGDFSVKLKNASIKGSLKELDLDSGSGQLNVLTNKFDIGEWQSFILPFEGYEIGGNVKMLLNLKGNFGEMDKAERLLNLTIEEGSIRYGQGHLLNDIELSLDHSPLALDIKEFKFKVNDEFSSDGSLKVYNLMKKPVLQGKVLSEKLQPALLLETFLELSSKWLREERYQALRVAHKHLADIFPESEHVQEFKAEVKSEEGQWNLPEATFGAYDGEFKVQATLDNVGDYPTYWTNISVDGMNLAKYSSRKDENLKLLAGKLFLEGQFIGVGFEAENWEQRIQGEGNFLITNGEFYAFNLLETLGEIEQFADLNLIITESTLFDDFRSKFTLRNSKFSTEDMVMLSPDLRVEAFGDMSLEGFLNYRLEAYLSPKLTDEILAPLLGVSEVRGDQQFGPIPLLLSGKLESVELRADSSSLAKLLEQVSQRRSQRVLRNFLPEDALFGDLDAR